MMLMTEHYMETTKKQFKTFKQRNIDHKIRQAKRMYEDLDSKLDEVSIGAVKIEEEAAAKIQEVTSSEKFNTRIEIQVRNGISDFLTNSPKDLQKEIRKYIQKESPE